MEYSETFSFTLLRTTVQQANTLNVCVIQSRPNKEAII